jgi:hypothetical protein
MKYKYLKRGHGGGLSPHRLTATDDISPVYDFDSVTH